jgi:hypothetical protein
MNDPLLAQSAIHRLVATSYELVIEGESYRRRQRPGLHASTAATGVSWQATAVLSLAHRSVRVGRAASHLERPAK